ncbi:hypothetical protein G6F64_015076 [Rhizopus arrhizus]|uniref:Uncharacterized protein n=1 Tax=Rhizopus oryzae TaxID=64495 RepID=A0A9P7BIW2_RHIOR|nr:hypothetical protein G6F64_015076 [Rhizopus arrhizus]
MARQDGGLVFAGGNVGQADGQGFFGLAAAIAPDAGDVDARQRRRTGIAHAHAVLPRGTRHRADFHAGRAGGSVRQGRGACGEQGGQGQRQG